MATKFVSGKIITGLLAAAISVSAASVPAMADSASASTEPFRKVVRYDDLDLSTAKGQKALDKRLRSAVMEMCSASPETGSALRRVDSICFNKEMAKVRGKATVVIAEYKAKRALARNDDAIVGN